VQTLAGATVAFGLLWHTAIMGIRASETGHGPYTTTYEIAVFFSWLIVVLYFLAEWKYRIRDLGSFVIPIVFLIMLYSAFLSHEAGTQILQEEARFWMTLHRALSIIGYAAFALAFAVGIMYLIQERQVKTKKLGFMHFRMPSLEVLDDLNYKVIAMGFPLFTLGFMTGSIWNEKMHSALFSWHLTKTAPLVLVWGIYCAVFFGRFLVGLRGKRAAQGAVIGFVAVILSYFLHV
jgi:ABC-type transport system involved in cytochrome c biogenesis permease subunit